MYSGCFLFVTKMYVGCECVVSFHMPLELPFVLVKLIFRSVLRVFHYKLKQELSSLGRFYWTVTLIFHPVNTCPKSLTSLIFFHWVVMCICTEIHLWNSYGRGHLRSNQWPLDPQFSVLQMGYSPTPVTWLCASVQPQTHLALHTKSNNFHSYRLLQLSGSAS